MVSDVHVGQANASSPVSYAELLSLAENLRWTWHMDARSLFEGLFVEATPEELEWPLRLLQQIGGDEVESRLRAQPQLAELARAVVDDRTDYLEEAPATWFPTTHGDAPSLEVAFLAAEVALTDSLPIFAGGLGAIAGEQLKSASALGVPLVGVGLLYRESSHQRLDASGVQRESWEQLDPTGLPVTLVRGADGEPVTVEVPFPRRDVVAQIWSAPVGRTWLYLLDTDVPQNSAADRVITARLYGGNLETRIQQELVLGVGGLRALTRCGHRPNVLHLNEGHTAFATLQLITQVERRSDVPFAVARRIAAAQMVFTTHTPVSAGHDYFPPTLAAPYLARYAELLGIELEELLALGRYRPEDPTDTFCPTVLALRLCDSRNGVSRLHGAVTRQQWGGLWPRLPTDEVPISHVTNGVHLQSWITPEIDRILDRQLGEEWRRVPGEPESWASMLDADDAQLWEASRAARRRLVEATRARRLSLIGRRRSDAVAIDEASQLLDPEAFTIGFVGRFVAYKRPTLFLRHPDRLARLLSDPDRPVQIVFAGKAHPNDEHGKRLLSTVADFAQQRGFTRKLVFIEDFDLTADRALSQGVDLWLNTPRRPLEACGIGGMKSGVNGALNLSTLDGWWDEAWNDADAGCAGDRLVHRHRGHVRGPRRCRTSSTPSRSTTSSSTTSSRGSTTATSEGIPPALDGLGAPVDGDPDGDLALAPDGPAVRRRSLPPERGAHRRRLQTRRCGSAPDGSPRPSSGVRARGRASASRSRRRSLERRHRHDRPRRRRSASFARRTSPSTAGCCPRTRRPLPRRRALSESRHGPDDPCYRASMRVRGAVRAVRCARAPRIEDAPSRFVPGLIAWAH